MPRQQAKRIDWDTIPVSIQQDSDPNPNNPYAASSPEERSATFMALARQILLRRARRIVQN